MPLLIFFAASIIFAFSFYGLGCILRKTKFARTQEAIEKSWPYESFFISIIKLFLAFNQKKK